MPIHESPPILEASFVMYFISCIDCVELAGAVHHDDLYLLISTSWTTLTIACIDVVISRSFVEYVIQSMYRVVALPGRAQPTCMVKVGSVEVGGALTWCTLIRENFAMRGVVVCITRSTPLPALLQGRR